MDAFAAAATLLQWWLDAVGLLSETMALASMVAAAAVLIAAGIYQWTPLKQACLRHCRSPLEFLLFHWRDGPAGAFASGVRHGAFCLGCCWMLMALLFVGGIMNLAWIGGIALLVLAEKVLPWGGWTGRATGVVMIAWGLPRWQWRPEPASAIVGPIRSGGAHACRTNPRRRHQL